MVKRTIERDLTSRHWPRRYARIPSPSIHSWSNEQSRWLVRHLLHWRWAIILRADLCRWKGLGNLELHHTWSINRVLRHHERISIVHHSKISEIDWIPFFATILCSWYLCWFPGNWKLVKGLWYQNSCWWLRHRQASTWRNPCWSISIRQNLSFQSECWFWPCRFGYPRSLHEQKDHGISRICYPNRCIPELWCIHERNQWQRIDRGFQ